MTSDKVIAFPDRNRLESEACAWVLKFDDNDNPCPTDIEALRQWANQSARHREALHQYADLWQEMGVMSELLRTSAPAKPSTKPSNSGFKLWNARPLWGAATAASVMLMLAFLVFLPQKPTPTTPMGPYQLSTHTGQTTQHQLPDGSRLWLNTDTQVQIDFTPQARRLTVLKGEAHFEVRKNPNRPFEVISGDHLVRAIGTAFSVRQMSQAVKVAVLEGKVELSALQEAPTLQPEPSFAAEQHLGFLIGGESVLMAETLNDAGIDVEQHREGELERNLAWRDGLLVFAGEPLQTVIKEFERYTTLKIVIADQLIGDIPIGGQFHIGATDGLFDVLERGFGLKVSRVADNQVIIERHSD